MENQLTLRAVLENSDDAEEIFRASPTLHDSEILKLSLDRRGPTLNMTVLGPATWRSEENLASLLVTLQFNDIDHLEISYFNHQNVIFGVTVEPVTEVERNHERRFRIECDSVFGAVVRFTCASGRVADVQATELKTGNSV